MATKVENLNKVTRSLVKLGVDVEDLKDGMAAIADEGARLAGDLAPKRKGNLRATVRGNRAKAKAVVSAGRGRVKYAGVINYGDPKRGIKGDGFMQKADEQLQPRAVELLDKAVGEAIKKAGLSD